PVWGADAGGSAPVGSCRGDRWEAARVARASPSPLRPSSRPDPSAPKALRDGPATARRYCRGASARAPKRPALTAPNRTPPLSRRPLLRQAEDPFGQDVVLDLVGAPGDAITGRPQDVLRPRPGPPPSGVDGEFGPEQQPHHLGRRRH